MGLSALLLGAVGAACAEDPCSDDLLYLRTGSSHRCSPDASDTQGGTFVVEFDNDWEYGNDLFVRVPWGGTAPALVIDEQLRARSIHPGQGGRVYAADPSGRWLLVATEGTQLALLDIMLTGELLEIDVGDVERNAGASVSSTPSSVTVAYISSTAPLLVDSNLWVWRSAAPEQGHWEDIRLVEAVSECAGLAASDHAVRPRLSPDGASLLFVVNEENTNINGSDQIGLGLIRGLSSGVPECRVARRFDLGEGPAASESIDFPVFDPEAEDGLWFTQDGELWRGTWAEADGAWYVDATPVQPSDPERFYSMPCMTTSGSLLVASCKISCDGPSFVILDPREPAGPHLYELTQRTLPVEVRGDQWHPWDVTGLLCSD